MKTTIHWTLVPALLLGGLLALQLDSLRAASPADAGEEILAAQGMPVALEGRMVDLRRSIRGSARIVPVAGDRRPPIHGLDTGDRLHLVFMPATADPKASGVDSRTNVPLLSGRVRVHGKLYEKKGLAAIFATRMEPATSVTTREDS